MEAIIGETIEDEAVEAVEFVVVVVIMRLLEAATELLKFVELVFVGILDICCQFLAFAVIQKYLLLFLLYFWHLGPTVPFGTLRAPVAF